MFGFLFHFQTHIKFCFRHAAIMDVFQSRIQPKGYQIKIRSDVNKSDDHAEYVALMDEVLNERGGGGNENERESIANDNNVAAAAAAAAEDHDDDASNNNDRRQIQITEQQIRQMYDEYLRGENYSHYVKPTREQLGRGAIFLLNAWLARSDRLHYR